MSFIYNFFLLYPYWFIKTIIHWILQFYKNIFCLHINENKIDQLSGFEFELLVQKLLIKSGYHDVKITQASGDYGIDILAKKKHVFYGFQCKRYQKNIGVSAIQQAYGGISYYHLDPIINILPENFFMHCFMSIVFIVLFSAFICYKIYQHYQKTILAIDNHESYTL